MKRIKCNKGFTMIEILVVITMLGILVAIVAPQVTKQLDKPKKSRAIVEIKTMKNAMDLYFAENNKYPADVTAVMQESGVLGGKFGDGAVDPWSNPYYIESTTTTYTIWSEGPTNSDDDGDKDDIFTNEAKTDVPVNEVKNLKTTDAIVTSKTGNVSQD